MQEIIKLLQKFRVVLLFVVLQIACMLFLIIGNNPFHRASLTSSSNFLMGTIFDYNHSVNEYFHLKEEVEQLQLQNQILQKQLLGQSISVGELYTHKNDTIYLQQYDFLPVKVINSTKTTRTNTVTLNKGLNHQIKPDMGVIGSKGLIGYTISCSGNYTTVMPIIHKQFTFSAQHKKSRAFGEIKWQLEDDFKTVTLLNIPNTVDINIGDIIETRGSEGNTPMGIPIGKVKHIEKPDGDAYFVIKLDLIEDFGSLYTASVVKNILKLEQKTLENPIEDE